MARTLSPELEAAIQRAAQATGVDPAALRAFVLIESGGNPAAVTGSYRGLLQLSPQEFSRHGGQGDIFDPEANLSAGARKIAAEAAGFRRRYGRDPTISELYLIHQQGVGGADMHFRNPDELAWKNMAATAEGRQKGEKWAKQAIWGNVPDDVKARYGSVDNLTSRDFVSLWADKVARFGGGSPETEVAALPPSPASLASSVADSRPASQAAPSLFGALYSGQPTQSTGDSGGVDVAARARQAAEQANMDDGALIEAPPQPQLDMARLRNLLAQRMARLGTLKG